MGDTTRFLYQIWKVMGYEVSRSFFPNGMLGSVYFSSVAQNDKGVINISGLEEELERLLLPTQLNNGTLPALYADDIYLPSTVIVKGNGQDGYFNSRMNSARVDVEHEFGLTAALFKRLSTKHTWHIMKLKTRVR